MSFLRDLWNKEKKPVEATFKTVKFKDNFGPTLTDFEESYIKAEKLLDDLYREAQTELKLARQLEATGDSYKAKLKKLAETSASDHDYKLFDVLAEKVTDVLHEAHIRAEPQRRANDMQDLRKIFERVDKVMP